MYKIRIKSTPSDKETGQQEEYGLVRNNAAIQVNPEQVKVNNKMGAIPREEANIEVEGGESVIGDVNKDGIVELMHFTGKRHHEGGIPVNIPEGSFIFSDTKKLTIKDPEILEKMFNLAPRKKGYTPAEISKKYEINQYVQILKDETADEMTKRSAAEMLRKNKQKLGILAFIQESMKGFPDGIPTIAEEVLGTLGINAEEVIQQADQQVSQEQQQQAAMQQQMMQQQMPPQQGEEPTMENPVSGNINAQQILDEAAQSVLQEDQQQPMMEEEQMPMAMGGLVFPKLKKYEDAGAVGDPPLTQEQINKLTGQLLRNRDLLSRYDNAVNRDYTSSIGNISYDAPTQEEAEFARTQIAEIEKILAGAGVNLKKPLTTLEHENLFRLAEVPIETEANIPGIGTLADLEEFKKKSTKHRLAANLYINALQYNDQNPYTVADKLISTAKLLESKSEGASSDADNFNIPWSFDWWAGSDQDKISENWPSILREKALKIYNEKQKDILLGNKEMSTDPEGNPILDANGNVIYRERNEDEKFTPDAVANKLKKLIEHYTYLSNNNQYNLDDQAKSAAIADKLKEYLTFVNNPSSVDAITALDLHRDIRGGMPSYKTWYNDVVNSIVTNTPGYERNTNIFNLDNYTSDVGYPITDYRIDPFNDESQTVMGMLKEINKEYDNLENLYTASGKLINKGKTNIAQKYQFPFAGINSDELFEESDVRRRSRKGNIFNTDIAQVDKIRQNIDQSKNLLIEDARKYMNEAQLAENKNIVPRYLKNYPGYLYFYPKDPNAKLEWYKKSPETGGLVAITPEELAILNEQETLLNKRAGNEFEVKLPASMMAEPDSVPTQSYPSGFDNVLKDSTKYTNAKAAAMSAPMPAATTNTVQPAAPQPYVAPSTQKLNQSKPKQQVNSSNKPLISFDVLKGLNKKTGGTVNTIREILNKEKGRYKFGGTIDKYGRILKRYDLGAEVTDDLADPDPTTDVTPKTGTPDIVYVSDIDQGGTKYKVYKQTFSDGTVYSYIKDSAGNTLQVVNEGTQQIYNDPTFVATRGNTEWITKDNLNDWEKKHIADHWNGDKGIDEYIKVNNSANKIATNPRLKQRMYENLKAGIDSPDKVIFSHGKDKSLTPAQKLAKRQAQANRVVETRTEVDPTTGRSKTVNVTLEQKIKESFKTPDDVMKWLVDLDTRNARMKTYGYLSDLGGGRTASDAPNATGAFARKTNKEAQQIIEANPDALGDISFDEGYLGQAAYLGFAKTILSDPEFQGKAYFKPTGTTDEDVWSLPAAISPADDYSTNTTLEERIELTDLIPPKEKTTTEEKTKITSSGKVKKSAYYCVEYTDGNRRVETVTYEEGSKPIPPNAANIKSVKELQSPNDSCAAPYEGSTPVPNQSTRWFAPDLVNLATGLRQRVPYTPPTLREMPMAPSGYDLLNPITQIAGVTGLVKQQQDLAMNTMDPTVGFAATAGLGYDELAKRIGDIEMQNVGIVNNWYDRTANRAMQVDQYNTNARRQFDIDTAVAREERARDLNKKDAQLAMLWGQGWKNAMNDNAMRVAYPNAWHVDRGRGTFNWSGVGRDPLMPDTYYSPVSSRGDADDISNQAITVYNDAERMFLQQNPGQTAEAKKHAAAMQKYYLDQQNKQSGKQKGNSQTNYNSGLPSKFKNGGLHGFGAYYTNPFD